VRQQQVVGDRKGVEHQGPPRGVRAPGVTEHGDDVRLVDRDPVLDPVPQALADQAGVLGEPVRGVAVQPAAVVLERLREVPVVERCHRLDVPLEQPVDEPVVEVEAGLVHVTGAGGLDPGPGDGEPVAADPEPRHQVEVLLEAVVVVAGDITRGPVHDPAGQMGEGVPDARSLAVLGGRPFDLVRRRADTEPEARWKQRVTHEDHSVCDGHGS
jgi:hypothetical protein